MSTLISTEGLATAPWPQRLSAWLHLAICRHCRAFRRQLNVVARAARLMSHASEDEPPPTFESKIIDRLRE
ncbi:MAG: hypothetical protein ABI603_14125 [Acidobacteriota bacterium]